LDSEKLAVAVEESGVTVSVGAVLLVDPVMLGKVIVSVPV
jgi:hypothetical protein